MFAQEIRSTTPTTANRTSSGFTYLRPVVARPEAAGRNVRVRSPSPVKRTSGNRNPYVYGDLWLDSGESGPRDTNDRVGRLVIKNSPTENQCVGLEAALPECITQDCDVIPSKHVIDLRFEDSPHNWPHV